MTLSISVTDTQIFSTTDTIHVSVDSRGLSHVSEEPSLSISDNDIDASETMVMKSLTQHLMKMEEMKSNIFISLQQITQLMKIQSLLRMLLVDYILDSENWIPHLIEQTYLFMKMTLMKMSN